MDILKFIKILFSKIRYLIAIPVVLATIMYLLTSNQTQKYYTEATIYTGITSGSSIEDVQSSRVDYFATQNAYNNVLAIVTSKSVLEETALRLFTIHLMCEAPDPRVISNTSFERLQMIVPEEVRALIATNDYELTYQNIRAYIKQDKENFIYALLNYSDPHYSIKAISQVQAARVQSSDMVKISYEADDAAICFRTIEILGNVFIERYNALKKNQSNSVVAYFQKQLQIAGDKLRASEDKLLEFNTANDIINYYEQTKHVSSQQEKIEVKLQEIKLEVEAATSVLLRIETEVEKHISSNVRNSRMVSIREQLIRVNDRLAMKILESKDDSSDEIKELSETKFNLESELKNIMDSLNVYRSNSEGLESQKMFGDWLEAIKEYESTRAQLKAMILRKDEFMLQYKTYAPLGASLLRIEREIDVNEREYLEILHHLGLAKLKQQNHDLMSDMKILDEPKLPINSQPSKRKILIIIIAIFGVIFYVVGLFLIELLDKRVRTPEKLSKFSGLPVISAFADTGNKKVDVASINYKAVRFLLEQINISNYDKNDAISIAIASNWQEEGKTFIANALKDILSGKNIEINEIPELTGGIQDPEIIKKSGLVVFIVSAKRTWGTPDDILLDKLKSLAGDSVQASLNFAQPDDLEDFYGEIPKKRSFIRRFIKKKLFKKFI